MSAHLFRVPISGSPFNAAHFVAAESPLEAYNKVVRLYPRSCEPYFYGVAEVESVFLSEVDGVKDYRIRDSRNPLTRLPEDAVVEEA